MKMVTRFRDSQPRARMRKWDYERVLDKVLPQLIRVGGERSLVLLSGLLDDAILFSEYTDEANRPQDYSSIWRQSIEAGGQSRREDLRGILVEAVRDTALQLVESDQVPLRRVIQLLEEHNWWVFHRLVLYLLSNFPDRDQELLCDILLDKHRFLEPNLWNEYARLLHHGFTSLEPEEQERLLSLIEEGPDRERFERRQDRLLSDEEFMERKEHWQLKRLHLIKDYLSQERLEHYERLRTKYHRDEEQIHLPDQVWQGPTSPLSFEELSELSVEEVADYLEVWRPSGEWFDTTIEGLSRTLSRVVAQNPDTFAVQSHRFKTLNPYYSYALISGLREALKQQRSFSWSTILAFCHWIAELPVQNHETVEPEQDWQWVLREIAELLGEGCEAESHLTIPFEMREEVWAILSSLTRAVDPTPEYEARYGGKNMDPIMLSLNTTRGQAMHTLIKYAWWVQRHSNIQAEEGVERNFNRMPEVRAALEEHLDPQIDPALAVRAVYGMRFPTITFLDTDWAREHVSVIFPGNENFSELRDAAWDAFITSTRPQMAVFNVLSSEYHVTINRLADVLVDRGHLGDPGERLAEHLMVFYWWGELDFNDPNGLIFHFFSHAPVRLRHHALEFVGSSIGNSDTIQVEVLERLRALWVWRVETILNSADSASRTELSGFGRWFISRKFDTGWALEQLERALELAGKVDLSILVVERLAEVANEAPLQSIKCLQGLVLGVDERWEIHVWRQHVRVVLTTALQADDIDAHEAAVTLVNVLGSRGYYEFQDLLSLRRE